MSHLLVERDSLYKCLGTSDMLSADQLSEFVKMFSNNILNRYGRLEAQLVRLANGDSFLRDVFNRNYWDNFVFAIYGKFYYNHHFIEKLLLFV